MSIAWATFKKELCEVLRDKRTLVLTVLIPLVFYPGLLSLTILLGGDKQKEVEERKLQVGVYTSDASLHSHLEMADEDVAWIRKNDLPELENLFQQRKLDAFIVMKDKSDAAQFSQQGVTIHYLSTVEGLASLKRINTAFKKVSALIVNQRLESANLPPTVIQPFTIETENRATARLTAGSQLGGIGAFFVVFLAFTGCMAVAVDAAAGEKERGTLEAVLATPAAFYHIGMGKLMFIVSMGLLSVASTVGGIGILSLIPKPDSNVSLGSLDAISIGGIILILVATVFFFASILFALSILAKSSKEAQLRSSMLMLLISMALMYCTLPGVKVTNGILAIPVLNVAMALRALWEGTLTVTQYSIVLGSLLSYALIVLFLVSQKVKGQPEKILLKQ